VRVSACSLTLPSPGGTVRGTHSLEKVPSSVSYRCEPGGGHLFLFPSATPARSFHFFHTADWPIDRAGKIQITLTLQFGEQQNQTACFLRRKKRCPPSAAAGIFLVRLSGRSNGRRRWRKSPRNAFPHILGLVWHACVTEHSHIQLCRN